MQTANETWHPRHSPQIASPGHDFLYNFYPPRARNDGFMAAVGRFGQPAQSRCELRAITLGDVVTKNQGSERTPSVPDGHRDSVPSVVKKKKLNHQPDTQ